MGRAEDILGIISTRKAAGEPFAVATVVRTVAATAAKAGAKAVILPDGTISEGWIGGGCARAAVLKAARDALADVAPASSRCSRRTCFAEQGVASGDEKSGVRFAAHVPEPARMSAKCVCDRPRDRASPPNGWDLPSRRARPAAEQTAFAEVERRIEGYALPVTEAGARYVVVVDARTRRRAGAARGARRRADYVAFVGSRRKAEVLKAALAARGVAAERLAASRHRPASISAPSRPTRSPSRSSPRSSRLRRGKAARGAAPGSRPDSDHV